MGEQMISEVDDDGSGEIDFEEFTQMMQKKLKSSQNDEQIEEAFHIFDLDGDGFLDAKEINNIMENLGLNLNDQQIDDMIKEADEDKDGKISYAEFSKMMKR